MYIRQYSFQWASLQEKKKEDKDEMRTHRTELVPLRRAETLPTSADSFSFVEEIKDVPTPLMVQSEYWPEGLHLSLSLVRLCFSWDTEENAES